MALIIRELRTIKIILSYGQPTCSSRVVCVGRGHDSQLAGAIPKSLSQKDNEQETSHYHQNLKRSHNLNQCLASPE